MLAFSGEFWRHGSGWTVIAGCPPLTNPFSMLGYIALVAAMMEAMDAQKATQSRYFRGLMREAPAVK